MQKQVEILWSKCQAILADNLSNSAYQTWFAPLVPLDYSNHVLVLQVKSQFIAGYIEDNYIDLLSKVLFRVFGPETQLEYQVLIDSNSGASSTMPSARTEALTQINRTSPVMPQTQTLPQIDPQLNSSYTFQSFVLGETNKLARTAGLTVAKQPGYNAFNPLFIYGGSGVGKTHLANAIGNQILALDPSKRVIYVSANTFKLQYQDAASHNHIPDFLNFYQQLDVLIVDDIQYFSGLKGTQDTFFHIFNYLQQSHKQLIMTSDRSPLELREIEERLLTRFKWGLSAEILRPDYVLRRDILRHKMRQDGIELPDDIVDFIATNVKDSVRDLEGVLASLLAYSTLVDTEINMALAEQVVSRVVALRPRAIDSKEILESVAEQFNLQPHALISESRIREVSLARHIAIYLIKELTDHSLNEIGLYMGHRSHATILHSLRQLKNQLETDPVLRSRLNQIRATIVR